MESNFIMKIHCKWFFDKMHWKVIIIWKYFGKWFYNERILRSDFTIQVKWKWFLVYVNWFYCISRHVAFLSIEYVYGTLRKNRTHYWYSIRLLCRPLIPCRGAFILYFLKKKTYICVIYSRSRALHISVCVCD